MSSSFAAASPSLLRFARALATVTTLTAALAACGSTSSKTTNGGDGGDGGAAGGGGTGGTKVSDVEAIYVVPDSLSALSEATFFDQPWPNDLRLENGSPRFEGYYNPRAIPVVDDYLDALKGTLDGFSPVAAGYLRFSAPIDPSTIPQSPKEALSATASVQLLDVDPNSPEHGQRKLVSVQWREPEGVYYLADTLAFMPTIGFPLRPHTRYALVVTDDVKAKTGGAVRQSDTVAQLVGVKDPSGDTMKAAKATLSPAVDEVVKAGIGRDHIVHLSVFTTDDPTAELIAVRDGVSKTVAAPTAAGDKWVLHSAGANYDEYQGSYGPSPNYQAGTIPFEHYGDGGGFVLQNGLPVLQNTFDLRFSIAIPKAATCPMPANGYPIVLYQHGTGGDWRSYLEDGTATALTKHCMAAMGVDQIFHGIRPGAPPDDDETTIELLFYNFQNPTSARTNGRQSAIDEVQRARLFTESHTVVPAAISTTGADIKLDPAKIMIFGHSQGGLNGPLFTAIDPAALGGVFSGSGADLSIALLEKTSPSPSVAALVTVLLDLAPSEAEEEDLFHPAISLLQSLVDATDTVNYGRLQFTEPRTGFSPKSVYQTEGINPDGTGDTYAPPHGIEAHALCMGLPLQIPFQRALTDGVWGGPSPIAIPAGGLQGNLAAGKASGVLAQWAVPAGDDGHFVVFDVPAAQKQAAQFLQNLAADPKGLVPAP